MWKGNTFLYHIQKPHRLPNIDRRKPNFYKEITLIIKIYKSIILHWCWPKEILVFSLPCIFEIFGKMFCNFPNCSISHAAMFYLYNVIEANNKKKIIFKYKEKCHLCHSLAGPPVFPCVTQCVPLALCLVFPSSLSLCGVDLLLPGFLPGSS